MASLPRWPAREIEKDSDGPLHHIYVCQGVHHAVAERREQFVRDVAAVRQSRPSRSTSIAISGAGPKRGKRGCRPR
jgi:hypothetical protein